MKIFFTHTHNFKKNNGKYFTSGGITDEALKRYSSFCDKLVIGARVAESSNDEVKNLSMITDGKVTFVKINYDFNAFKQIKELVKDSNYVIARLPSLFGVIAVFYSIIYKKKVLVEVVGNAFDALWFHSLKGKVFALPFHFVTKLSVFYSDYVTYITKSYLQFIYPTKGIKKDGISNIVIDDLLFENNEILNKRINRINQNDVIKIGMIANLSVKYKGHKEALMAISELKKKLDVDFILEFVGGGNNDKINHFIKKNGLEENVKIIGTIPNELIFDWLDSVDIYIQPSKTEAHGRSVIESMSRACSVVTSDIGGMKETVLSNYRFKLNDIGDFANKIEILIKNREIRIEQAIRNYEVAKEFKKSIIDNKRKAFFNQIFK